MLSDLISSVYIEKWEEYGMSRDGGRAKLAYDWHGSWTTLYSLYADAILCFHPTFTENDTSSSDVHSTGEQTPIIDNSGKKSGKDFIPDHIYQTQSEWYLTAMQKYGVSSLLPPPPSNIPKLTISQLPLDSRHLYTKSDWEFQAAAVASPKTRTEILERVATWLNETASDRPFTDLYKTEGDGGFPGPNFFARPVVGSHFAFLTMERACKGSGW